jgi:hypothetical protein
MPNKPTADRDVRNPKDEDLEDLDPTVRAEDDIDEDDEEFEDDEDLADEDEEEDAE